jgi:hypothetical protein
MQSCIPELRLEATGKDAELQRLTVFVLARQPRAFGIVRIKFLNRSGCVWSEEQAFKNV